jgi:hypothetical protein
MRDKIRKTATPTMFLLTLILTLILVGRTSTPTVRAEDNDEHHGCSLETLHGSYGSGTTGLINSSSDPNAITIGTFVPYAEAALFTFDGRGNLSGQAEPDFGGQIGPLGTATGSYTVDATCTGTMTINISGGPVLHRSLVIVQDGRNIEFVSTDPGLVIAGSMKKQ